MPPTPLVGGSRQAGPPTLAEPLHRKKWVWSAAEARHHDDRDRVTSGKKEETYPVEDLSEAILETLFQAYRVTNIGEAGYNALQRFSRLEQDRAGQETDRESVDHVDGGGETAE